MVSLKIDNLFSHVVRNSVADNRQLASRHISPFTFHLSSPRRGFTLIELLIVTVVIVTLMGIVFRLAGVGGELRAKSKTQARLQRLENAVSGYYAAYGSYPPVPLQGRSRDINLKVDGNGIQGSQQNPVNLSSPKDEDKKQIEAACRAQPVAVLFPFFMNSAVNGEMASKDETLVTAVAMEKNDNSFSYLNNVGGLKIGKEDEATLFQFGLLSFLLPRYKFMLKGAPEIYDTPHSQWAKNNQLPCRIDTGKTYESWESMQKYLYGSMGDTEKETFLIESLSSQAVCSRWMPNLEGIVSGGLDFYGVDTSDRDWPYLDSYKYDALPRDEFRDDKRRWMRTFSQGGYDSNTSMYLLNGMTVADGWGREFYYFSDPPYQNYRLWSAGKNGYTFPPWLMEHLGTGEYSDQKVQAQITEWTSDDISHLAN